MNIFFLHRNPKICARYHLDRHVVKMILETCQLLCTAIWVCGGEAPYKKTHENHPSAIWTRQSKTNWMWLKWLGLELCIEYTYRYGKIHKSQEILVSLECPELPNIGATEPIVAMDVIYRLPNAIDAYRNYYIHGKRHLHRLKYRFAWKNRDIPKFILKAIPEYKEQLNNK